MFGLSSIPGEGEYKQSCCGSEWPAPSVLSSANSTASAVPWIAAWNFGGVAVVLPLYCYYMSLSDAIKRDHTVPLNEARALLSLTVAGLFFPLLLFGPASLGWGTHHEHGYIAHYMWAAPLGYASVLVLASRPGATSRKNPDNPDAESELITMSYMIAGVYAAAIHVVC